MIEKAIELDEVSKMIVDHLGKNYWSKIWDNLIENPALKKVYQL
ncbi:hypothetical protein [Clostridium sp. YIM B02551]|nr:hypothetical protein [Clostridium sp. YIM B02551]